MKTPASPPADLPDLPDLRALPVEQLRGAGPRIAERLAHLGVRSVADLLLHLPLRYQDRTCACAIAALRPGQEALVQGRILTADIHQGRRRALLVALADADQDTGARLWLRFFHFGQPLMRRFQSGAGVNVFGEVRPGPKGLEMIHPELAFLAEEPADGDSSGESKSEPLSISADVGGEQDGAAPALTPVYPTTEGLSQTLWRSLTEQSLALLRAQPECLPALLPESLLGPLKLPPLTDALRILHRPPPDISTEALLERRHPAFQRLALEELIAQQLALRVFREQLRELGARPLPGTGNLVVRLRDLIGFELTRAQSRVLSEIAADLAIARPMLRLLQGDVGSGKTIVAALAAAQALESDAQVALMAPTELLAEQHLRSFKRWFVPLGIEPQWLAGRHKGAERASILRALATGAAPLVVGTHALFQEDVQFDQLGLVIIDEQHRFGVHQRLRLREKGQRDGRLPHQLIMTATPIPRSLAMTAYADLDLSVIDELPPGRQPIQTIAVPDTRRSEVMARLRAACESGRQAYWVCTLVEESEALQCQAAEDAAAELTRELPGQRIGLVHGRMKPLEREPVMSAFAAGELQVLVATTVIEVGVDVPNASLMIIENPERLGLAQLHQLRGRVGRGRVESVCLLLYHPPLTGQAFERLKMLREERSGFKIADADLRLRGAGEVLGTRQSGHARLRLADPLRDQDLVQRARELAAALYQKHPELVQPLIERWVHQSPKLNSGDQFILETARLHTESPCPPRYRDTPAAPSPP
ncbi:ATP-dependent DNA helicase RecG [Thiorhodovibrio frisius]|uniref:ATP-dependent DNA helicase RecG n=1 Tax=Thiorhodovibrio frisius TaxID=631362 RepID=H8Z0T0_9GAMM|nr:ATP-dependent DNA helicase RecG [Thiorhodovibrio frisius]EIC21312.1 ATP-dependent DNA helicase RecG [Thiorhodovibrio frisius]WPL23895.1 ATP-dependent DNA helicase RecG [Thiorhodovibrio frisius]